MEKLTIIKNIAELIPNIEKLKTEPKLLMKSDKFSLLILPKSFSCNPTKDSVRAKNVPNSPKLVKILGANFRILLAPLLVFFSAKAPVAIKNKNAIVRKNYRR